MSDKSYNVKDKAREILNVFKEKGIKLEDIDFNLLEQLLKEADKSSKDKYIGFHCPYCGKEIFMNIIPNVDEENFEEKYYCSCGENSRIQYDFITGKLNIGAIIELINKK